MSMVTEIKAINIPTGEEYLVHMETIRLNLRFRDTEMIGSSVQTSARL